jgi:hypothetical protein
MILLLMLQVLVIESSHSIIMNTSIEYVFKCMMFEGLIVSGRKIGFFLGEIL